MGSVLELELELELESELDLIPFHEHSIRMEFHLLEAPKANFRGCRLVAQSRRCRRTLNKKVIRISAATAAAVGMRRAGITTFMVGKPKPKMSVHRRNHDGALVSA